LKDAGFEFRVWNPLSSGTEIPDEAADQIKARFDGLSAPTIEELLELDPHLGAKDLAGPEGRILIKKHLIRERNQALVKKKKRAVLSTTGRGHEKRGGCFHIIGHGGASGRRRKQRSAPSAGVMDINRWRRLP
jgi:hypothetical protein